MCDWRLQGQEKYLLGAAFRKQEYTPCRDGWTHDHCEFCGVKFSENENDVHEGYVTLDGYHWVCGECFSDFVEQFKWQVRDESNDVGCATQLQCITYSDETIRKRLEAWAQNLDFDPEDQLSMLLEDRFDITSVKVLAATPVADAMIVMVETDAWEKAHEFALTESGSLVWSGPCPPRRENQ